MVRTNAWTNVRERPNWVQKWIHWLGEMSVKMFTFSTRASYQWNVTNKSHPSRMQQEDMTYRAIPPAQVKKHHCEEGSTLNKGHWQFFQVRPGGIVLSAPLAFSLAFSSFLPIHFFPFMLLSSLPLTVSLKDYLVFLNCTLVLKDPFWQWSRRNLFLFRAAYKSPDSIQGLTWIQAWFGSKQCQSDFTWFRSDPHSAFRNPKSSYLPLICIRNNCNFLFVSVDIFGIQLCA